jgi:hypothetical protein
MGDMEKAKEMREKDLEIAKQSGDAIGEAIAYGRSTPPVSPPLQFCFQLQPVAQ